MNLKKIKASKGQIFTLDAFLALLIVTIAIGLIITQFESMQNSPQNNLQILSSDFAQILTKRTLIVEEPNNLTTSQAKLNEAKQLMNNVFLNTNYEYEIEIYNSTDKTTISKTIGCSSYKDVAITKVPAIVDNQEGYLEVKICK